MQNTLKLCVANPAPALTWRRVISPILALLLRINPARFTYCKGQKPIGLTAFSGTALFANVRSQLVRLSYAFNCQTFLDGSHRKFL